MALDSTRDRYRQNHWGLYRHCNSWPWCWRKYMVRPKDFVDGENDFAWIQSISSSFWHEYRWMRGLRSLEQNAEKIDRELRIRSELRKWDEEFPYFHHEMVVRYAAGFLASSAAMLLYGFIRGHHGSRRTRRDWGLEYTTDMQSVQFQNTWVLHGEEICTIKG